MKRWISPHYFGTAVVNGVKRFVRRMTAASDLEVVPQEDLDALHRELMEERRAAKGEPVQRRITPDRRSAEEIAADAEFEMSRKIAEFKDPQGARLLAARIPRKDR
jgi:hypothetical protein